MKKFMKDIKRYWKYTKYAAKADLEAEVTNAYLEWFWWILEPVCNMFIYFFIFAIVFHNQEEYYLVFIYSAITMWNFFQKIMTISVKLVKSNKSIISRVYVPKPILLIEKMEVDLFKMFISCGIVVILMIPYKIQVDWHLILLIPIFLVFIAFTYGCGCFLMHFGVYVEDLSYIVNIVLKMVLYFTGIFYSVSTKFPSPFGAVAETINPIAFLIASMRNALMYRRGINLYVFVFWALFSCILVFGGVKLVYKNENNYVKVI